MTSAAAAAFNDAMSTNSGDNNDSVEEGIGFRALGAILLCASSLCLIFCLVAPGWFLNKRRRQLAAARLRAQQAAAAGGTGNASAWEHPHERYAKIEAWLVSKPVLTHDGVCDHVLSDHRSLRSSSLSTLSDSNCDVAIKPGSDDPHEEKEETDHQNECSICYEPLEVSDIVSWSPNPNCCQKAFHHGCLKEWVLHNDSCPWCREKVLPLDMDFDNSKKQIQELLKCQVQRSQPCFYCRDHGIVHPRHRLLIFEQQQQLMRLLGDNLAKDSDWRCQLQERSNYMCSREELEKLRGSHFLDNEHDNDEAVTEDAVSSTDSNDGSEILGDSGVSNAADGSATIEIAQDTSCTQQTTTDCDDIESPAILDEPDIKNPPVVEPGAVASPLAEADEQINSPVAAEPDVDIENAPTTGVPVDIENTTPESRQEFVKSVQVDDFEYHLPEPEESNL